MDLDQEIDAVEVEVDNDGNPVAEVEVKLDDEQVVEEEVKLDDDGNPVAKEVEAWQLTEDEDELPDVPVGKHIKMKQKLKGRLKERDSEIDTLKAEIEQLKSSGVTTPEKLPPKPKPEDFDSDADYEAALETWDDKRLDAKLAVHQKGSKERDAQRKFKADLAKAVDEHYERQAELVEASGIKVESFKEADTAVRETVEAILPKQGDMVTDQLISLLGKGSEKVMYFIGRNKAAKLEFQSLLAEDKTGMKAMVFLGQQKERLNNPKKVRSKAPKPVKDANGDLVTSQSETALQKKYSAAHKAGKTQDAYNIKKQAKKANIDTSSW